MYTIIWQYTINPVHLETFVEFYNSNGTWAQFFQQSPDYVGTDFLKSEKNENQFITIDMWLSQQAYEQFLEDHKEKYQEIDKRCEGFTVEEALIGKYFTFE
jgi:hypothetical protein